MISFHLDSCRPYCTACYNSRILRVRPPPSDRLKHQHCRCAPITPTPNIAQRYWRGSKYYSSRQNTVTWKERAVCRECSLLTHDALLEKRERRTRMELRNGVKPTGEKWTRCGRLGCRNDLGTGPRWWICQGGMCGKECTSLVHGAWGKKGVDTGEVRVGDDAV
jgi:hypothetical protein